MKTYWDYIPLAYDIYYNVFGKPKTHGEWANGFNIRGKIIETLMKNDELREDEHPTPIVGVQKKEN
jgi:hypothetical protein